MAPLRKETGATAAAPPTKRQPLHGGIKKRGKNWAGTISWKDVTPVVASELLVGSDEGGFMSLEEVDGDVYLEAAAAAGLQLAGSSSSLSEETSQPKGSDGKKRRREKGREGNSKGEGSEGGSQEESKKKQRKKTKNEAQGGVAAVRGETGNSLEASLTEKQGQGRRNGKGKGKGESWEDADGGMGSEESGEAVEGDRVQGSAEEGEGIVLPKDDELQKLEQKKLKKEKRKEKLKKKKEKKKRKELNKVATAEKASADASEKGEEGQAVGELIDRDEEGTGVSTAEAVDMSAWEELRLHPLLQKALASLGFKKPTPIQIGCIPAAAHQGKDVVGAAETGSGKTLAFGLPILQRLLQERDKAARMEGKRAAQGGGAGGGESQALSSAEAAANGKEPRGGPLRALIVTPTRELALQVCDHLKAAARFAGVRVVAIVGGIAPQKQERLLRSRPEVVVATPGRLWELMSNGQRHLLELQMLSFFVLDEADRMVERGHFRELHSIIDLLPSKAPAHAQQAMPNGAMPPGTTEDEQPASGEAPGEGPLGAADGQSEASAEREKQPSANPNVAIKKRQTLVFSATLSLPPGFRNKLKKGVQSKKAFQDGPDSVAGLIERAGMSHRAAVVDLTTEAVVAGGLEEAVIECVEEEKDLLLYYVLRMHGASRTLVFCTSIAALRRVAALLQLLELPTWALHAQMQQRQRLKALDRFKQSSDGVLVATDVAARGLDIAGVRTVVHYQLPHSAEVYVHRCGRTARAGADGCSVALVSPSDRGKYATLLRTLSKGAGLRAFPVNAAYLPQIRKCVQLAVKVDEKLRKTSQSKARKSWVERNAEELGLEVEDVDDDRKRPAKRGPEQDEEEGDGGEANGRTAGSKREAAILRAMQKELHCLLEEALRPKAFSTNYFAGKEMSPLMAQQLQELKAPKRKPKPKAASSMAPHMASGRRPRLTVIGHDSSEALAALQRLAGAKL